MARGLVELLTRGVQEVHHGEQQAGECGEVGLDVGVAEGEVGQANQHKSADFFTSFALARVCNFLMELTLTLQQQSN